MRSAGVLKLFFRSLVIIATLFLSMNNASAATAAPTVVWTAVFSDFTPIEKNISRSYCRSHTPSVIVTTIKQITSKQGVMGLNNVNIRYLSYRTVEKDHLYFNIVNVIVRGKAASGKSWSYLMKLYEQT